VWPATVLGTGREGERVRARLRLEDGTILVAEVTVAAADELRLSEGGPAWAAAKATEVEVYPA
jgi:molybdopterin-binding protein